MSIEKSELKILLTNNIGEGIADRVDSARRTANQLEGAVQVLKVASKKVTQGICANIDQLKLKDNMPALEVASMLKKYVTKCGDFLDHLSEVERLKVLTQHGEVKGLETALAFVKKLRDEEIADVQKLADYLDKKKEDPDYEPPRNERPKGIRPGPSKLADRRAEAKKLKAEKLKKEQEEEIKPKVVEEKRKPEVVKEGPKKLSDDKPVVEDTDLLSDEELEKMLLKESA